MKGYKVRKIFSHLKKHKKIYFGILGIILLAGIGTCLLWNCPATKFKRYCKDEKVCPFLAQRLTTEERDTFIAISSYREKTGKQELGTDILQYAKLENILEVNLKVKAASADVIRSNILDNMLPADKLPGDRNCLRQVYLNELSNEEILFLNSPQSKSLEALKDPVVQGMYVTSSAKLMKCMNEQIQKQYLLELQKIKETNTPAPKKAKKKS